MDIEKTFQKWHKWLKVIHSEMITLLMNRYIFNEVQEIVEGNPRIQKPTIYYSFLGQTYSATQLITVRRQVKNDKDSISFAGFLTELSVHPEILTTKRFVMHYDDGIPRKQAYVTFSKLFDPNNTGHLESKIVVNDLKQLNEYAKRIDDYTDKRIAHYDEREPKSIPTFVDLDKIIDYLEKITKFYLLLFEAVSFMTLIPTIQYNWKVVFREKWIKE